MLKNELTKEEVKLVLSVMQRVCGSLEEDNIDGHTVWFNGEGFMICLTDEQKNSLLNVIKKLS